MTRVSIDGHCNMKTTDHPPAERRRQPFMPDVNRRDMVTRFIAYIIPIGPAIIWSNALRWSADSTS